MPAEALQAATRPVLGVYDSGAGGLSVLRHLRALRPDLPVLYMADTARVPYGDRSADEVRSFNREIAGALVERGATHLVVACNTSCALALPELRETLPVPVTGLLETASRRALEAGRDIGILATVGTIRSDAYGAAIRHLDPRARVRGLACTTWVPLVESGAVAGEPARRLVQEALSAWQDMPPLDAVILGCTHFPFLGDLIRSALPGNPRLVDPGPLVAAEFLAGVPGGAGQDGLLTVWSSGDTDAFLSTVQRLVPEMGLNEVLPWRLAANASVSLRSS